MQSIQSQHAGVGQGNNRAEAAQVLDGRAYNPDNHAPFAGPGGKMRIAPPDAGSSESSG
jgi:hypothetical protein